MALTVVVVDDEVPSRSHPVIVAQVEKTLLVVVVAWFVVTGLNVV